MTRIIALPFGLFQATAYLIVLADRTFLIDPAVRPDQLPQDLPPIRRIFATHGHLDHISQADFWRQNHDLTLAIHQADQACFVDPTRNLSALFGHPQIFKPAEELLQHLQVISLDPQNDLVVYHTPGHTPGGCCFLLRENGRPAALFSGDTLFAGAIGRLDLGGNEQDMIASLRILREMASTLALSKGNDLVVYPGHGPETSLMRELTTNPYFQSLTG
ncbi:MAG: MBL fold metallo-hydrolase [Clostridiaceae bacterium]|nr:MBL fold metallo-hydrolase [Clostridiaceae bacterium]